MDIFLYRLKKKMVKAKANDTLSQKQSLFHSQIYYNLLISIMIRLKHHRRQYQLFNIFSNIIGNKLYFVPNSFYLRTRTNSRIIQKILYIHTSIEINLFHQNDFFLFDYIQYLPSRQKHLFLLSVNPLSIAFASN